MLSKLLKYNYSFKLSEINTYSVFYFLSIFFPLIFIIGPLLLELICLFFIFFCINYYKDIKKYILVNKKIEILIFSYFIYLILLSLISIDPKLSLESSLFLFRYFFFIIFFSFLLLNNSILKNFIYIIFFLSIILSIDGLYEYFFSKNILGFNQQYPERLSSFFKDELILGSFLSRIFCISVLIFLLNERKIFKKNYIFISYVSLIGLVVFLSGERTSFIILILNISILVLIDNFRKQIFFIFLIMFLSVITINLINPNSMNRMIEHTKKQILLNEFKLYPKEYLAHFEISIKMFKEKPVFGHGTKIFREECKNLKYKNINGCSTHTHNFFLQSLSETGILGTSFLVYFFFLIFKRTILIKKFNYNRNNYVKAKTILGISFLINFLPFLTTGNLFNNWLLYLLSMPLIFFISLDNNKLIKNFK